MAVHLGSRISALLDGQLSPDETERAWEHVHTCHACRDLVEREGWVKTRLAGLSFGSPPPRRPDGLKGSLLGALAAATPGDAYLQPAPRPPAPPRGLVALGGGAVGAAVMGVLALGVAPADAPQSTGRAPASITHSQAPRARCRASPT